ncbi:1,2-dihydroxy-3-keto-5-methylthiopentene dioxygenase [Streptantibioticus silvisoli]|uniref:Acireductone dioxygenase n=1 Tax=Streptantibioticus silvisoli TaxID=2705255 RepID=A0ABT6W5K0_9ACTN|nr:cupin domain-containing protein [Streptantibioticus silvisoli]MDI5966026.1 cupin domain-containing protein [Streptantibioticus silvisoli]
MTLLQVMPDNAPRTVLLRTRDDDTITKELAERGVSLRHWPVRDGLGAERRQEDVLALYRAEVDALCAAEDLRVVDVAQLTPADDEAWREKAATARKAFLDEHRHAEDEVRYFAAGTGCFYLHLDGRVYAVVCEAGDLLSVPAGTRHWFDMGPRPDFCAIRFFRDEDGWVGDFTGDQLGADYPRLDALLAEGS